MKVLKTVLVSSSILFAIVLWLTRDESLRSLSAFALSDNAIYYRMMHFTASWFFITNALTTNKCITEWLLGFGMGLILAFDMYHFPLLHNIITASVLGLACYTLIYRTKGFERKLMILLSISAVSVFIIGFKFHEVHLLLAEIVAMVCIMNGKLYLEWKDN